MIRKLSITNVHSFHCKIKEENSYIGLSPSSFCVCPNCCCLIVDCPLCLCLPISSCDICIAPIFPRESSTSNLCDFGLRGPFPIKMALGNRPEGIFNAQRIESSLRGQVDQTYAIKQWFPTRVPRHTWVPQRGVPLDFEFTAFLLRRAPQFFAR